MGGAASRTSGQKFLREVNLSLFTDYDTPVLIKRSRTEKVGKVCLRRKMKINVGKSEVMSCSISKGRESIRARENKEEREELKGVEVNGINDFEGRRGGEMGVEVSYKLNERSEDEGKFGLPAKEQKSLSIVLKVRRLECMVIPFVL